MPLSLRRQVFATLRPYRVRLGFALVQVVLIGGAELLKPWPLKVIIDNVLGGQRLSWSLVADWSRATLLLTVCVGLVVVYIVRGAPTMLNNYEMLADILTFAGRPEEASGVLEKALRLNLTFPAFLLADLGLAYQLTGRYEEALACCLAQSRVEVKLPLRNEAASLLFRVSERRQIV